jgi:Na+/melibiose symporter-like transporter
MIDPDSVEMIHGTQSYPSIINNNFKIYLKMYLMFYSLLSALCVILIHPYQSQSKTNEEDEEKPFYKRKLTTDPSTIRNLINIDKNFKEEDQDKGGENNDEDENEDDDHYIKYLLDKICCKKKKIKKGEKVEEPFSSLIISFPFIQLTFIFFFTMIIGFVELSSIRKLGSLNGHSEFFLWKTSFLFKAFNASTLPLWGYILDKIGFKTFYSVILIVQIIISSMCFFISSNQVGFILFNGISALLHSVNLAIQLTTYVLIFGNEKGVLLYSISWMSIYIFYIARPFISNIFVSKIQYLMFYITLALFTMIALIILSFFVEKKHIYTDESKGDENSDEDKELEDMKFEESESDEDDDDNIENKKKK